MTGWLEPWLQLYDLLPHLIKEAKPEDDEAASATDTEADPAEDAKTDSIKSTAGMADEYV